MAEAGWGRQLEAGVFLWCQGFQIKSMTTVNYTGGGKHVNGFQLFMGIIWNRIKCNISHDYDFWQWKTIFLKTYLETVFELILCKNTFTLNRNFMKLCRGDDCGYPLAAFPARVHAHQWSINQNKIWIVTSVITLPIYLSCSFMAELWAFSPLCLKAAAWVVMGHIYSFSGAGTQL